MWTSKLWLLFFLAGTCLLGLPHVLYAAETVHDGAHLFGPDAIADAEKRIEEIVEKFHFNHAIVIETFPAMPAESGGQQKTAPTAAERKRSVTQWVAERVTATGVEGVYILICKDPEFVQVEVLESAKKHGFSQWNGDRLQRKLQDAFKKDRYDSGLETAVDTLAGELETSKASRLWLWLMAVVGVVLGIWFVLAMVRNRLPVGAALEPPVPETVHSLATEPLVEAHRLASGDAESPHAHAAPTGKQEDGWLFDDKPLADASPAVGPATATPEKHE
jgi:hypothetical protein